MVGEGVVIPDRSLVRSMLFPFDKSWALLLFEWTDDFLFTEERDGPCNQRIEKG